VTVHVVCVRRLLYCIMCIYADIDDLTAASLEPTASVSRPLVMPLGGRLDVRCRLPDARPTPTQRFVSLTSLSHIHSVGLLYSVAEWIARPTAVSEDRGSNHAADGRVYRDSCCDIQPWVRAVHLYCSAYVDSAFHSP